MSQKKNRLLEVFTTYADRKAKTSAGVEALIHFYKVEAAYITGQSLHRITNWTKNKTQPGKADIAVIAQWLDVKEEELWS